MTSVNDSSFRKEKENRIDWKTEQIENDFFVNWIVILGKRGELIEICFIIA